MFFNDFIFFLRIKSTASSSPMVAIGEQHWLHLSVYMSDCERACVFICQVCWINGTWRFLLLQADVVSRKKRPCS